MKNFVSHAELYHENSKLYPSIIPKRKISQKELEEFMVSYKKSFPAQVAFPLKRAKGIRVSIEEVIKKRRSCRNFRGNFIPYSKLSKILSLSYGSTGMIFLRYVGDYYYLKSAPSAGGLYSCGIYVIANKIQGLPEGVYYFNSEKLQLELIRKGSYWKNFLDTLCEQDYVQKASCALIISGDFFKIKWKYGERGYRYIFLDAGHIGENVYLTATALNLGVIGICGFYDDLLNAILRIDGYKEAILYVLVLGNKN